MTQFRDSISEKFGINKAEADSILNGLNQQRYVPLEDDKLDYIELFLAVSLNAKMRGATQDPRYQKLKLLLNNNSTKAVNLANLWVDGQMSFDKMLATI